MIMSGICISKRRRLTHGLMSACIASCLTIFHGRARLHWMFTHQWRVFEYFLSGGALRNASITRVSPRFSGDPSSHSGITWSSGECNPNSEKLYIASHRAAPLYTTSNNWGSSFLPTAIRQLSLSVKKLGMKAASERCRHSMQWVLQMMMSLSGLHYDSLFSQLSMAMGLLLGRHLCSSASLKW